MATINNSKHRRAQNRAIIESLEPRALLSAALSITDVGVPSGMVAIKPSAINISGKIVGQCTDTNGRSQAFEWTASGGLRLLGTLSGYSTGSAATGVNDAGDIVGYAYSGSQSNQRAFLKLHGGAMEDLGSLAGAGGASIAKAINNAGQVVGSTAVDAAGTQFDAFLWTRNGGMQDLGGVPTVAHSLLNSANAINDIGEIVGQVDVASAIWTAPGNGASINTYGWVATGINHSGGIVGSSSGAAPQAILMFSDENMIPMHLGTIPDSPFNLSYAAAINDAGQIVGAAANDSAFVAGHAFLSNFPAYVAQDINNLIAPHSGYTVTNATAINNRGQIAAIAVNDRGQTRALLLNPTRHLILSGISTPAVVGTKVQIKTEVKDAAGQLVTTENSQAGIIIQDHPLRGDLSFDNPIFSKDGVITANCSAATAGDYILIVSDGAAAPVQVKLSLSGAAVARLRFEPMPTIAYVDTPITPAIKVDLVDVFDNIATGDSSPVTLSCPLAPSSVRGDLTVTADHGIATFSNVRFIGDGNYYLFATTPALAPMGTSSPDFTVTEPPVIGEPVTVSLNSSNIYPLSDETINVSARVQPATPGGPAPTGTVTFRSNHKDNGAFVRGRSCHDDGNVLRGRHVALSVRHLQRRRDVCAPHIV